MVCIRPYNQLMAVTKRRFFVAKEPVEAPVIAEPSTPSSPNTSLFVEEDDEEPDQESQPNTDVSELLSPDQFNKEILSTVGEVSPIILSYLYDKYSTVSDAVKQAVAELLTNPPDIDELTSTTMSQSESPPPITSTQKRTTEDVSEQLNSLHKRIHLASQSYQQELASQTWDRYIGSIDVQAWATRPTFSPLKYAERLSLKRLIPKNSSMKSSSIIRLSTIDQYGGREIARIPEDLTRIFSPLIDLDIARFEVTVLEATKRRLSTADSFLIQIDVFFKNTGFVKNLDSLEVKIDNKPKSLKSSKSNFHVTSETDGEAALRLRQYALSRLFERLRIKPLRLNEDKEEEEPEEPINLDSEEEDQPSTPDHELNLDQLKQFYQANNQSKLLESLPETTVPPSENFNLELRTYQKHGLSWMLTRENEISTLDQLSSEQGLSTQSKRDIEENKSGTMNPLWRKYKWPIDRSFVKQATQERNEKFFYANVYNGELSIEKPILKTSLRGGILADEMGLGKTISALALINSVPCDSDPEESAKPYASKTTLIVVPMSLLSQWKQEFEKCNNNSNNFCKLYYGDEIVSELVSSLCSSSKTPTVLITTYGTVLNEFTRIARSRSNEGELPPIGLYSVKFFRIIIDEGHNIRNRNTKTAKSLYELQSSRKWILTGTPIVNRLDDLYSFTKFLQLEPWSNFSYWKTFVTLPFEQRKISQTLDVIKSILEPIFLRRTKAMKGRDGNPLVELPSKEVTIEEIKFNDEEEKLYEYFKARAFNSFKEGLKSGQLMRQYTQILTHILRLRQVCCHVDLIGGAHEMDDEIIDLESDEEIKKFLKSIKERQQQSKFDNDHEVKKIMYSLYPKVDLETSECSICTQTPIPFGELTITPCGHSYCLTCLLDHLDFPGSTSKCPTCRDPISKYKLFRLRNQKTTANEIRFYKKSDSENSYPFQLFLYDPNRTSSKIQALIKHLNDIKSQTPNSKVIVFSQFSSYLDIIETELKVQQDEEFVIYKFDGRLNLRERQILLDNFNEELTNGKVAILLLSLKAGGVGLNLTTASRAFMMDPWWSPSIEDQAIDRIHRIGQNETVKVVRFIMENSIETKMLKIQERKKQIGEVVAVEEEERRKRRIEEIQILFEE
ncbi:DNA repair protein RAD5 [Spathaspora sp. JA1]|nr:DNA repair protein RAD5 [Spathaspora sp. JA1]